VFYRQNLDTCAASAPRDPAPLLPSQAQARLTSAPALLTLLTLLTEPVAETNCQLFTETRAKSSHWTLVLTALRRRPRSMTLHKNTVPYADLIVVMRVHTSDKKAPRPIWLNYLPYLNAIELAFNEENEYNPQSISLNLSFS
jgi:hypothetical protein